MALFVVSLLLLSQPIVNHEFSAVDPAYESRDVTLEVEEVMATILGRGEHTVDGVSVSTWVPPVDGDRDRIRKLGTEAVKPLTREVDSAKPFRQLLALQLLEVFGGEGIIPAIQQGLKKDRWVVVRMQSLSDLRYVPSNLAIPILETYTKDADGLVAQRAKDVISTFFPHSSP